MLLTEFFLFKDAAPTVSRTTCDTIVMIPHTIDRWRHYMSESRKQKIVETGAMLEVSSDFARSAAQSPCLSIILPASIRAIVNSLFSTRTVIPW